MGMTIEKAWFVLEHGSAEGLPVYLEAIDTIKEKCVEIVRCKDCKNADPAFDGEMSMCKIRGLRKNDWFCSDGKRRDDDD